MDNEVYILGIESSCDDTSAAVAKGDKILANVIAGQQVHEAYGGVVPELASRAHQQNIIPVVDQALKDAKIEKKQLTAIAYTQGPGLMGSLLVGASFAKSLAMSLGIPIIEVNHMQGHVLAHFAIKEGKSDHNAPELPFLCLTVSGGHTQIVEVKTHLDMQVIGRTLDDAAGEAFDKIAKMLGLPYPGGHIIDQKAARGNPMAYPFPEPKVKGLDFSFSGFKTAVMYFLQKKELDNPDFISQNMDDICASVQSSIVKILTNKLIEASLQTGIVNIAIAGGVSANTGLRDTLRETGKSRGWKVHIPEVEYCTDNAAMIAVTGYHKYLAGQFANQSSTPFARFSGMN
jgi:tRNA N6-adenosine threonylcarbamoyltransferase